MFMKCKTILLGVLLLAIGAGCRSGDESDTAVDAALSLSVSDVRTYSASVTAVSKQNHVVSCLMTAPIPVSEINWRTLDAIDKMTLLESRATVSDEFTRSFSSLTKQTAYFVVAAGCNAKGEVVTAPVVTEFETGDITISVETGYELLSDGTYRYKAAVTPDESVAGYSYLFDFDHAMATPDELSALIKAGGSDIKSASGAREFTIDNSGKTTAVIAIIGHDVSGQEGGLVSAFASALSVVTVDFGASVRLSQPDLNKDIFEGIVDIPAKAEMVLNMDGVQWGFMPYSGNGGIGSVQNMYATVPYYYISQLSGVNVQYSVAKSIGRMQLVEEGGKSFWFNMGAAAKVYLRFDFTSGDGIPRYYMETVTDDPSIVLDEQFDLFSYSGDYMAPSNGAYVAKDPTVIDGTEQGTLPGINAAQSGTTGGNKNITAFNSKVFCWPSVSGLGASNSDVSEAYIRNRGMQDWTLRCVGEKPGAVQLCVSNGYLGTITTPALTALDGATDITVTLDMARFSAASKLPITFKVLGAGTLTSGTVLVDGNSTKTLDVSGSSFAIGYEADVCPPSTNNDMKNKPVSHFVFKVSGATADTRISIDTTEGNAASASSQARCFIFGIKITK